MKTKHYLFVLLAQFFSMTAFAYDAEIDGIYYDFNGTEATVTSGDNRYTGDIVIPSTINNNDTEYSVTSIESSAFLNCWALTSITIPSSVTKIGESAFSECTGLTAITIPESVTSIGEGTFSWCSGLTSVTSNITNPQAISSDVFGNVNPSCVLYVPASSKALYEQTDGWYEHFSKIVGMRSLTEAYDAALAAIQDGTDYNIFTMVNDVKYYLTAEGTLTTSPHEVGLFTFEKVTKESGLQYEYGFRLHSENNTYFGNPRQPYEESLTNGCLNVIAINRPDWEAQVFFLNEREMYAVRSTNAQYNGETSGWTWIGNTYWTVNDGVSGPLAEYSFDPNYIWQIEVNTAKNIPFADENVKSICVANWDINGDGKLSEEEAAAVTDLGEAFKGKGIKSFDELRYFTGLTSIGNNAFWACYGLTSVTIPESVTNIGNDAFGACYGLTSVTIPESVTNIGSQAFRSNGLTSITIPESVTSIGYMAFAGCSKLISIVVEEGNTVYDSRNGCNAIIETVSNTLIRGSKNTTIPENVISISAFAFDDTDRTSIIIPEGVTSIGVGAFQSCPLTSITIPNSVSSIGASVFSGCSNLTSIIVEEGNTNYDSRNNCNAIIETSSNTLIAGCQNTMIPNNVTSIGKAAFYGCSGLSSITIPNSVTSIGDMAFYNCNGLTSITIPGSVKRIRYSTFWACSRLKSVTISNGVKSIETNAFDLCDNLISVSIPNSVTRIEDYAFSRCSRLTDFYCYAKNVPTTNSNAFSSAFGGTSISNATLHVPAASIDAYKTTAPWCDFKEIVICNYVDVEDQTIVAGSSSTMEICVNNYDSNFVAFQMDLTLPDGVNLDKAGCSLSSRITDEEQELTIGKLESGVYRLTSTSLSLTPISGNDGTLLTLKLTAAKDCAGGQATINNIIFSTSESEKVIMSDESFDINIVYKYNLTYKVDGEVYKTEEVVEAMPLSLEAEPTKDGYTFGGWSELPEIMPNHDVEVIGRFYLYGDVNTDEEVDVVDVVDIARFVVATPSASFREKLADLNYDNTVNIADAVTLVNHIAGDQNFVKAEKQISGSVDYTQCQLQLQSSGQKALSLSLAGGADFTAFQFEVDVPENTDITAMRINGLRKDGHQLLYNKVSENRYRVAALSLSNATFLGSEGELLNISIDGLATDDVCIHDIHFVKANGTDVTFDTLYLSGHVTNIADVDGTESGSIYDLQGRHRSTLQRGLNIVGNKTIIKK